MEEIIEKLSQYYDDETIEFILESYSLEELDDLLAEFEELEEDSASGTDNSGKYIEKVKAAIKKLEKYKGVLETHIKELQFEKRNPPFIYHTPMPGQAKSEAKIKEEAKKHVKVEAKQIADYKERISKDYKEQFNVQYKRYKKQLKEIKDLLKNDDFQMAVAWGKWLVKQLAKLGPYALLIIIAVILMVGIIVGICSLVQTEEDIADNGLTSTYGVNGESFYGVRLIYEDKEKEKSQFISDYEGYITAAIKDVEENIKDEETNLPIVDITLEIPENYDYFAEGESAQKTIVTNIATEVFKIDNPSAQVPATLTEIVGGIKYFGINADLHEVVATAIAKYINETEGMYQKVGEKELPPDIETKIENQIKVTVAKNVVRTEKLFIEDRIFESSDDSLTIKDSKNYRAMIYMPKNNVTFDWFSIKTYGINKDNFKIYIRNGSAEPVELSYQYVEQNQYFYESSDNLGVNVAKYEFDMQHKVNGSLAELGKNENAKQLLANALDEEGNPIENVYTYAPVGMQLMFESDVPFLFAESETKVQ